MVLLRRSLQTKIFNNVQRTAGLQNIVLLDIYYIVTYYSIWFGIKSSTMISFVWISNLLLKFGLEINRF